MENLNNKNMKILLEFEELEGELKKRFWLSYEDQKYYILWGYDQDYKKAGKKEIINPKKGPSDYQNLAFNLFHKMIKESKFINFKIK